MEIPTKMILRNVVPLLVLMSIVSAQFCRAEEPKPAETPAPVEIPAGPRKRESFSDAQSGYSVLLPSGYSKLTENETHEIFKGLSEFMGKEASERAQKRPPAWFKGPIDPKNPNLPPPMFAVGFSDLNETINPAQLNAYKEKLEEEYKRQGNKFGEIDIKIATVDGITALQVEHDIFSPINNEKSRVLRVAVPAKGKWFDLNFNFSTEQSPAVHDALKEVLDSFKISEHQSMSAPEAVKWQRVLIYTVSFGLAGVLLSLIMKKLSSVGASKSEDDE